MAILLLADHDNRPLSDRTAKARSAGSKIGPDLHVLVAGKSAKAAADQASKLSVVAKGLLAERDDLRITLQSHWPLSSYRSRTATTPSFRLRAASARVSCRERLRFSMWRRFPKSSRWFLPILSSVRYAGNAIQTVQTSKPKKVITVRTASFAAARADGSAPVEEISVKANSGLSTFVADVTAASERPELTSAKIVISGGRALGSSEKFKEVILPVADKLGAAVGASRLSMPAMRLTTGKSVKRARLWLLSSTSPAASQVPSGICLA